MCIFDRVKTVIIGSGNLAWCLARALHETPEIELVQTIGRNTEALQEFRAWGNTAEEFSELLRADVYLLAVADQALSEFTAKLPRQGLWAHCSGSTPLAVFDEKTRAGVFYPLQTFTKGRALSFADIPIGIEARTEADYALLEKLGKTLSHKVFRMNSGQRQRMHLAAVWANNFSNHLFARSAEICESAGIEAQLLYPLIEETVEKMKALGAKAAQTGPARRQDKKTMNTHVELLDSSTAKRLYKQISKAIDDYYEDEREPQ